MKIYYRKIKKVSREKEEDRFKPIGPWRMAVGGSPLSLYLPEVEAIDKIRKRKDKARVKT